MTLSSNFSQACLTHLQKIEEALAKRKEDACIETRTKQLEKLLDNQREKQLKANEELEDIEKKIIVLKDRYTFEKAVVFSDRILEKIRQLKNANFQVQSAEAPACSRRVFQRRSLRLSTAQIKTQPKSFSISKDLEVYRNDVIEINPEKARALGISGFVNAGGNDCYQNALCQALLTEKFKQHVIERLPDPLRGHFHSNKMHSQQLRRAIYQYTEFFKDNQRPMSSQEDATALFETFFDVIDQEPEIKEIPSAQDAETSIIVSAEEYIKEKPFVVRFFLFTFFIPVKFFSYIFEKISDFLFKTPEEIVIIPAPLPPRVPKETFNPLKIRLQQKIQWQVDDNIPEEIKNHDNFGGDQHLSITEEQIPGIFGITLKNDEDIDLNNSFQELFHSELISSVTKDEQEYQAPATNEKKFLTAPEAYAVQVRRFHFGAEEEEKKFNIVNNFETLTISKDLIVEENRPENDIKMQLQSFVIHKGSGVSSGHYVACRKVDDAWYYFDDSNCAKITNEAAARLGKHAYMYFFEKEKD